MLLENLNLGVIAFLLNLKALIILNFDLRPLALYFLNEFLELGINYLDVLNPPQLHLPEHLLPVVNKV